MSSASPDPVARFSQTLRWVGGSIRSAPTVAAAAAEIAEIAREQGTASILYQPCAIAEEHRLADVLAQAGVALDAVAAAGPDVDGYRVGLTGAELAIAETGTLLLGGRPGGWGLASILPWVHVVLLRLQDIVADLRGAFAEFRERFAAGDRDWAWITGPSRTADIAKTLVMGIHGPNSLEVILLQNVDAPGGAE